MILYTEFHIKQFVANQEKWLNKCFVYIISYWSYWPFLISFPGYKYHKTPPISQQLGSLSSLTAANICHYTVKNISHHTVENILMTRSVITGFFQLFNLNITEHQCCKLIDWIWSLFQWVQFHLFGLIVHKPTVSFSPYILSKEVVRSS